MTLLPQHLQGLLHVIELPVTGLPKACFCYLRPQRISDGVYLDSIDNKILEAIQRIWPTATISSHRAIFKESLTSPTAQLRKWYPFQTILLFHAPIPSDLQPTDTDKPEPLEVNQEQQQLNIFTMTNVEDLSNKIITFPDSPEVDEWHRKLSPYTPILNRVYDIELTPDEFNRLATVPIIDYQVLRTQI